jgi:hypothetical protein
MPQQTKMGESRRSKRSINFNPSDGPLGRRTPVRSALRITGVNRVLIRMSGRYWPDALTALLVSRTDTSINL